jgi:hypothetical protein
LSINTTYLEFVMLSLYIFYQISLSGPG